MAGSYFQVSAINLLWQLQQNQSLSSNTIQVHVFPCGPTEIHHSTEQIYKFLRSIGAV